MAKSPSFNIAGIPKKNACVVLVKTEWNEPIVNKLESSCIAELQQLGVKKIKTVVVPGAVEIPFAIRAYWDHNKKKKPDAFIALGCVIKGDTPHFEYVCHSVTEGVLQLNLTLPVPVIFGVLTVNNEEQANERTGGKAGDKGREVARTAIKMIVLKDKF
jgi:6,7-dimethyl-8-ribityllumazine synthase